MADFNKESAGSGTVGAANKPKNNFLAQPKLLKTSVFSNPFAKVDKRDTKDEVVDLFALASKEDPPAEPVANPSDNGRDAVPVFVPLHLSRDSISFAGGTSTPAVPDTSAVGDFVFGQNLKERIVNGPQDSETPSTSTSSSASEHSSTNGTSLFFTAASQAYPDNQFPPKTDGNSLAQSAQTWEKLRESSMPPLPPQQVLTGEEEESNQLQMHCRLFAFESGLWKERGRGHLRLNDGQDCSRLVCRSAGSLRIMLNTKIWSGMTIERAGNKSLRITATDSQQQLKIFLIMANPDEITHLHNMLMPRFNKAKANESKNCDSSISKDPTETEKENCENKVNDSAEEDDNERNNKTETESENCDSGISQSVSEDDGAKENLKRHRPDDESCKPKKLCTDPPPSEEVPL